MTQRTFPPVEAQHVRQLLLSVCIATYRRGAYLGETLEAIIGQLTDDVEIVIVDGGSPDETPQVASAFTRRDGRIRYVREATNSGVDQDYDKAVGYARGTYCWLMTDDDIVAPHAVQRVLAAIATEVDVVVVNARVLDRELSKELSPRLLKLDADQRYVDAEAFFRATAEYLSFIGGVVVRRAAWLARDRASHYGSLFVHVGVLFQQPAMSNVIVIAEPLITIRYGNAMWTPRSFEIWMFKWPGLIWSFDHFSSAARQAVCQAEPFRRARSLLWHRAIGSYSLREYRAFVQARNGPAAALLAWLIATLPPTWANATCGVYLLLNKAQRSAMALYDLTGGAHTALLSRALARRMGVR